MTVKSMTELHDKAIELSGLFDAIFLLDNLGDEEAERPQMVGNARSVLISMGREHSLKLTDELDSYEDRAVR